MAESVNRLSDYEKAQARYQDLLSGSDRFKSLVEKQLGEKTNYNKDLIEQQQRLMEKQLSLPSQLRSEFSGGPIRNPLAQEAIIQQRASNVGQQLGSVSDLLAARGQRQGDMLNSALSTYQTRLAGEQTAAEAAWRLYQDALAREQAARGSGGGGGTIIIGGGDMGNEGGNGDVIDITVDDGEAESPSKFQSYLDKTTVSPTDPSQSSVRKIAAAVSLNPFQQARNIGTYIGNLAGNWQNQNMSFLDKLLNRR